MAGNGTRRLAAGTAEGRSPVDLNVVVDTATLAALDQLACDGTVTRIVTAGASVVLDMGRRTRVVTPAQRRALTMRGPALPVPRVSTTSALAMRKEFAKRTPQRPINWPPRRAPAATD